MRGKSLSKGIIAISGFACGIVAAILMRASLEHVEWNHGSIWKYSASGGIDVNCVGVGPNLANCLGKAEHASTLALSGNDVDLREYWNKVAGISDLRELEVVAAMDTDLDGLSKVPRLNRLIFNDVKINTELALPQGIRELRMLGVSLRDYSSIGKCSALEALRIAESNLSEISFVQTLPSPLSLELIACDVATIDVLQAPSELRSLDLSGNGHLQSLRGLSKFPKLCDLALRNCKQLEDISEVAAAKWLLSLDLEGCENVRYLPSLTQCRLLDEINISHTGVSDISPLVDLKSLKSLSIIGLTLSDYADIGKLTELEYLALGSNSGLNSIEWIVNLQRLKSLFLREAEGIVDISYVSQCVQLEEIWLPESVRDISALRYCSRLRKIHLVRKPVQGVGEIPLRVDIVW